MTRRLRIDADAEEELAAAIAWYEGRRSGLGRGFLDAVDEALIHVRERPKTGSPVPGVPAELGTRRVAVKKFPYSVIFMELATEVRILAFAHARRRPGYWRKR